MTEKTTPIMVTMAAAIVVRICRAASALPLITQPGTAKVRRGRRPGRRRSVPRTAPSAAATSSAGTYHRLVRKHLAPPVRAEA